MLRRFNFAVAECAALLDIIGGIPTRQACSTLAGLAARGHDATTLDGLVDDGWLARWDLPGEVQLTFSAWGAEQIGIEIDETASEVPIWVQAFPRDPEPGVREPRKPIRLPDGYQMRKAPKCWIDRVADLGPTPDEEAELAEAVAFRLQEEALIAEAVARLAEAKAEAKAEAERYYLRPATDAAGNVVVDEAGAVVMERVTLFGQEVPAGRAKGPRRSA